MQEKTSRILNTLKEGDGLFKKEKYSYLFPEEKIMKRDSILLGWRDETPSENSSSLIIRSNLNNVISDRKSL